MQLLKLNQMLIDKLGKKKKVQGKKVFTLMVLIDVFFENRFSKSNFVTLYFILLVSQQGLPSSKIYLELLHLQ